MRFLLLYLFSMGILHSGEEVIVSVAPYKFIVERISGGEVKAHLLVPEGSSPHSYEPSPKQVMAASKSAIWFTIGEHFEEKGFNAMQMANPQLKKVDLRAGLSLIPAGSGCGHGGCCALHGYDLHIWLSPFLVKKQAETIAAALSDLLPEKKNEIRENLEKFLGELNGLEAEGAKWLAPCKGKTLLASHGAFGYVCRDFGLEMLTLEHEGKEASPRSLSRALAEAKRREVRAVIAEVQYSQKPAQYVAEILLLKVVPVNPYKEDYLVNMRELYSALGQNL